MEITKTPSEAGKYISEQRANGKKTGFVPTMGALHDGHISLFRNSLRENDITIGSIFVNPRQFNNKEDLKKYPRDPDKDLRTLEQAGCDMIFMPDERDIYTPEPVTGFNFGPLESVMEGKYRPGHFSGVALIVAKLLNILSPHKAYFGQKDLQQFVVIRSMVRDLSMPVELEMCPIIRESNGLAMSSRNVNIPEDQKETAGKLFKALRYATELIHLQESPEDIKTKIKEFVNRFSPLQLEYFEIADVETLQQVHSVKEHKSVALCIAAYLGSVRLIDNVIVNS